MRQHRAFISEPAPAILQVWSRAMREMITPQSAAGLTGLHLFARFASADGGATHNPRLPIGNAVFPTVVIVLESPGSTHQQWQKPSLLGIKSTEIAKELGFLSRSSAITKDSTWKRDSSMHCRFIIFYPPVDRQLQGPSSFLGGHDG